MKTLPPVVSIRLVVMRTIRRMIQHPQQRTVRKPKRPMVPYERHRGSGVSFMNQYQSQYGWKFGRIYHSWRDDIYVKHVITYGICHPRSNHIGVASIFTTKPASTPSHLQQQEQQQQQQQRVSPPTQRTKYRSNYGV